MNNARGRLNLRVYSNPDAAWRKQQKREFRKKRRIERRDIVWIALRSAVVVIALFALAMKCGGTH